MSESLDPKCPKHPRGKHSFTRVPPDLDDRPAGYRKWYEEHAQPGWTRLCNRCFQGDAAEMCSYWSVGYGVNRSYCDRVAVIHRPYERVWSREDPECTWPYCKVHDPWPHIERRLRKERIARAASEQRERERVRRAAEDSAKAAIVSAAEQWRQWHFPGDPCPDDPCEHLDCQLARAVDRLKNLPG